MIAALPMYDLPWARAETDRLWAAIRAHLPDAPNTLTRGLDPWDIWRAPDLLLAQTCGMPYRTALHDHVTLVGTPDHGLPDCPPGHYYSTLIRRHGDSRELADLAQGVMAYNDPVSQSGWAAPVAHLAQQGLRPTRAVQTGAHLASVSAVLNGRADFAAIDTVTLRMWATAHPADCARIDMFDRTKPTPALPYITSRGTDPTQIAAAIDHAIGGLDPRDKTTLWLKGLISVPSSAYRAVATPSTPAEICG